MGVQVQLAREFAARGVAGVDLSGNPTVGEWQEWRPALDAARQVRHCMALWCEGVHADVQGSALRADQRPRDSRGTWCNHAHSNHPMPPLQCTCASVTCE